MYRDYAYVMEFQFRLEHKVRENPIYHSLTQHGKEVTAPDLYRLVVIVIMIFVFIVSQRRCLDGSLTRYVQVLMILGLRGLFSTA